MSTLVLKLFSHGFSSRQFLLQSEIISNTTNMFKKLYRIGRITTPPPPAGLCKPTDPGLVSLVRSPRQRDFSPSHLQQYQLCRLILKVDFSLECPQDFQGQPELLGRPGLFFALADAHTRKHCWFLWSPPELLHSGFITGDEQLSVNYLSLLPIICFP